MDKPSKLKNNHIAIVPNPGAGHLISLVELARHLLIQNPSLSFTFILIPTTTSVTPDVLSTLPVTCFDVITLPPPSFPPFSSPVDELKSRVFRSVKHSLLVLRKTLEELTARCQRRVSALIVDMFATDVIPLGFDLGIKSYLYFSPSAIGLSFFLQLPKLPEMLKSGQWDLNKPLNIPGSPPIQAKDLPDSIFDRNSVYFDWLIDHSKRFELVEAIIVNSFPALECGPLNALPEKPPVYAVGPLVRKNDKNDNGECLRWLDDQPPASVLYVSFGSGGTLSTKQVTELAFGLELSDQRFIWVVRAPNDSASHGTYFTLNEERDPLGYLPSGFLERVKGRGYVVEKWGRQVEILAHESTRGFVTHCGWNSVLEGVVNGVGFIAWPLFAEQRLNAVELVDVVRVALRVEKDEDGVVYRDEIAKVVKMLMVGDEGLEISVRMKILKDEAARAISDGGSSNVGLAKLAGELVAGTIDLIV